jgi:hypothetical protein
MTRRSKSRASKPNASARTARRDALRRQLAQKIADWASPHDSCVVQACRRNKRCLIPDACRGFSDEPLDDDAAAVVRRNLRALKAYADGGPEPDEWRR